MLSKLVTANNLLVTSLQKSVEVSVIWIHRTRYENIMHTHKWKKYLNYFHVVGWVTGRTFGL